MTFCQDPVPCKLYFGANPLSLIFDIQIAISSALNNFQKMIALQKRAYMKFRVQ